MYWNPNKDIAQLSVNQRPRKREIVAILVFVCTVLSSRCGLNMKHFQTSEYSQERTSMTERTSQEEDSKVSCHLLWTVVMRTNTEETKVLQKRGLSPGCIELEQNKD